MKAGAELGLLELIANGTTSFLDMYWMEEDVLAPATRQAGLRAWLGEGMVDVGGATPEGQPNKKIAGIERFVKATAPKVAKDPATELVTACPAPHGTYTCHDATYLEASRISREHGVPLHTHCAETRTEVYDVQARTGRRPVAQLLHTGALHRHTVLAHAGWVTKDETRAIGAEKASVAHCPVSNLKLATGGVTPVPELHDAGVKVGLGTDGAASNNSLDLWETMKFAALVQKNHRWDATVLPAQKVLDMATRDGADALHRPDLGRIQVGATADLVLVDFRRPHLVPRHDAVSHLVYAATGRDVSATIVGGRVLMAQGKVETLDADKVMAAAQKEAERIVPPSPKASQAPHTSR
jgi:5-methylthioadenosine/S-adenosylhomocysteine deaminase